MRALPAFLFALFAAAAASALDLDTAKSQGLVGERLDGYVGAVAALPSAEVSALVSEVNAKRKSTYEEIAKSNGATVEDVAGLAAQKLVQRAAPGEWIYANEKWGQKQ